ncbi:hypothetical protein G6L94_31325 [Agrobacterium rhizogenes]|nr:hypothetical protein [Rhizobium rhizogenes]NTI98191.1 hypothetical protein [Rhizobium rhizogenes]NTJ60614.1 hypothetical protein [Rhizobium rhizogenes]
MQKLLLCMIVALLLSSCNAASNRVSSLQFGDAKVLTTTGNLRLVTSRARYQPNGVVLNTVCTEPSPDYAIAFGSNAALAGNATLPNGSKGDLTANYSSSEQATALAGRTAGVLALRDGLYAACQSYANGVIGHDAYAMILSQYGDLLVSLAGSSNAGAAATAETTGTATTDTGKVTAGTTQPVQKLTTSTKVTGSASVDPMKKTTLAALLVACISEHDPTRFQNPHPIRINALLSEQFCKQVVAGALKLATSSSAHG